MRKLSVLGLALGLVVALAVPAAAAPKGDNTRIWDFTYPVKCGTETIGGDVEGWTIVHEPGDGSGLVDHFNFHLTWTFTNADGDSWVFRDVGHGRARMVGDDQIDSVSGHSTTAPPVEEDRNLLYGHWIVNRGDDGEGYIPLKIVGNQLGTFVEMVCGALATD